MSRRSNRGNPYHYPKGHPRGGQFAPKGYAQAAASVNGMYFESRKDFEEYRESFNYESDSDDFYGARTHTRFTQPATDGQKKLAEQIAKKTGKPLPEGETTREYEEYITENFHDYVAASEGQARAIRHLEENLGVNLAYDDRYGGSAGSYMGHMKTAETVLNKDSWEKYEDGCYYHNFRKSGEPGAGYRIKPIRVNGKTRYKIERGESSWVEGEDGKKIRETQWHPIDEDGTGLKSVVKDDLGAARKRCALNETKRYQNSNKQHSKGRKRKPEGMIGSVAAMKEMGSESSWEMKKDGSMSYDIVYDQNNSYTYTIEQGTTGLHAFRDVTSVQTMSTYNPKTGKMETKRVPHTRREWVATGCATPGDAMKACQKHEAKTMTEQRIDPKAASDKELERWKASGRISSKTQYGHLMDEAKKMAK